MADYVRRRWATWEPRRGATSSATWHGRYSISSTDGLVFPDRDGGVLRPAAWRQRVWHPAVERAGLAPLVLRHAAVPRWIADGADPKRIAVWAGHKSVRTILDPYGHLLDGDDEAFMAGLDARLDVVEPPADARVLDLPQPCCGPNAD